MLYDVSLTRQQLSAIWQWAFLKPSGDDIEIASCQGGLVAVGQGDARCEIDTSGMITEGTP